MGLAEDHVQDIESPVVSAQRKRQFRTGAQSPAASRHKEKARVWIVKLVFVVYWLLIFEGALRKWALPGMHTLLFFIRDPFVLATYVIAYKYKLWPRWTPIFTVGCAIGLAFIPLFLLQGLVSNASQVILAYGWRNYFFYLPFAFIIGEQFKGKDLKRLVRHTLFVAIPISLLCYQQFRAPATDVLNQSYVAGNTAMLVAYGIVRTSGTFTVSAAQTLYIAALLAMVISTWLIPRSQRPIRLIWLLLASAATLTTFAVSGARSAFFQAALVVLAALASVFMLNRRRPKLQTILMLPALLVVGVVGYLKVFPTAAAAMVQRQLEAQVNENTYSRLFDGFTGVLKVAPQLTLLGLGLGAGTNASAVLSSSAATIWVEDDWSRILLEAGVLGILYILYRIWMSGWLVRNAVIATDRSRNPLPLCLVGFEAIVMLTGQITLQGSINGFAWLFAGFCMAANRLGMKKPPASTKPAKIDLWS